MHHKLVRNRHLRQMELQQKKQEQQQLPMQPQQQEHRSSPTAAPLLNNHSGRSHEPARINNNSGILSSIAGIGQADNNQTLPFREAELGMNDGQSSVNELRARLALLQEQQFFQSAPQGLAGRPQSLLGPGPLPNGPGITSSSAAMRQPDAALAQMLLQQERQQQLALQLERYRIQQQHLQMQSQAQNRAASLLTLLDEQHLQQERRRMLQQEVGATNSQDGALGLLSAASLNPGLGMRGVGSVDIRGQSANSQSLMALRAAALSQQSTKRNLQEMSGSTMPNFQGSSPIGNDDSSGQNRAIAAALEESLTRNKRARTMSDGSPGSTPLMAASAALSGSPVTQNGLVASRSQPNVDPAARISQNAGSGTAMTLALANSRRPSGENSDDDDPGKRFRPYQSEQWTEKFAELCDFRAAKGHCQVPHTYADNPPLARWVKRQRYQYKLKMENKQSTMTDERIRALEEIGFIWDSHAAAWEEKLNELKEYSQAKGNCNVPSTHPENPQLATWVKCQRRQYKLLRDGRTSNMTIRRITALEKIGFVWEVRKN